MKAKDLLEIKKIKQELALIREQKGHIVHSLGWYRESKEVIEKQYNLLKNQLEYNEKRMKEAEKWITSILDQYDLKMCDWFRCREIKPKKEMKFIEKSEIEVWIINEWFCDDDCYQKKITY